MIVLWAFQIALDVLVVGILVKYFLVRGRRRSILQLERILDLSQTRLNTPLGSPLSTLSEKKNIRAGEEIPRSTEAKLSEDSALFSSPAGLRVRDAKRLLNQGFTLSEVSQKTGLSHAELSLLEKTILGGFKDLQ
jgi:hypothetical protein